MKLAAHQFKTRETFPYDPCMNGMFTYIETIKINQMSVNIPYMECLGLLFFFQCFLFREVITQLTFQKSFPSPRKSDSIHVLPSQKPTNIAPEKSMLGRHPRLLFGGVKRPIFRGVSWLLVSGRVIYKAKTSLPRSICRCGRNPKSIGQFRSSEVTTFDDIQRCCRVWGRVGWVGWSKNWGVRVA